MLGGCVQVAPSAIVGAIVEIIVGAIVGALFGTVIAITLTTIHTAGTSSAQHCHRRNQTGKKHNCVALSPFVSERYGEEIVNGPFPGTKSSSSAPECQPTVASASKDARGSGVPRGPLGYQRIAPCRGERLPCEAQTRKRDNMTSNSRAASDASKSTRFEPDSGVTRAPVEVKQRQRVFRNLLKCTR